MDYGFNNSNQAFLGGQNSINIEIPPIPTADYWDEIEGWEKTTSDANFLRVKRALRLFVKNMQDALKNEDSNYKNETTVLNNRYTAKINEARQRLLVQPNAKSENDYQSAVRSFAFRWSEGNGLKVAFNRDIMKYNFNYVSGIGAALIKKMDQDTVASLENERRELGNLSNSVGEKIRQFNQAAQKLRDAEIALHTKTFLINNEELEKARKAEQERIDAAHRQRRDNIAASYRERFTKYFSREKILTAFDAVKALMKPAVNYTCATKIPDAMFFGLREVMISTKDEDGFYPEIINLFKDINLDHIVVKNNEINVILPYSRTIDEGYSVFVSTRNVMSNVSENALKAYVLKILMNFPVGQTRPVFFDSDSQATFTMFTTIGESSQKGLVTRPWYEPEDITREMNKIATERANLNISYGENIKSRLEREPIYFVAGRNFPKGVSEEALSSLYTIFLAGAKNGFFGVLQANEGEIESKKGDHKWISTINTIRDNSFVMTEINGVFYVKDSRTNETDRFVFDNLYEVFEDERIQKDVISAIISGVSSYKRQIEKFEYLFSKDAGNVENTDATDVNTWFRSDATKRFEIPIGISGASTVQKYVVDSVAQHALISGVTQSGKSSLLRTMIVSSMIKYTPENINFYLVDFKEGVEFEPFSRYKLPWIKVVALNTQRDFALVILQNLAKEFKRRADKMREYSVSNIGNVPGEKFPRIVFIFDEVQELLRENDSITNECVSILAQLVSEGAAMNINIILTSQDFTNCNGLDRLMANMVIRIAFKGSPNSAKKIMGEGFAVTQLEQGDGGYAAINSASGSSGKTNFFQVGYLSREGLNEYLSTLATAMQNKPANTQILSYSASQDIYNKFNRFICDGEIVYSQTPENYELVVGDTCNIAARKLIKLGSGRGDNLLVIGETEYVARSVFSLSIMSALYDELACGARKLDNELVRIIDLSEEDEEYFTEFKQLFNKQIGITGLSGIEEMINDTYSNLLARINGEYAKEERLFLAIFGLDAAFAYYRDMYSGEDDSNFVNKLVRILEEGPQYGINTIIWTHNREGLYKLISQATVGTYMRKRLFFGSNMEDYAFVSNKAPVQSVIDNKALLYADVESIGQTVFRAYAIPELHWVESLAERYQQFIDENNEEA